MRGLAFRFRADTQRTRKHYRCPGACALPAGPVADRATIAAGTDVALVIWRRTVRPGGGPRARGGHRPGALSRPGNLRDCAACRGRLLAFCPGIAVRPGLRPRRAWGPGEP